MEKATSSPPGTGVPATDAGPRVAWDDSGTRTVTANVVQVKCSREEATLLFGSRSGEDPAAAVLETAVMLPPATAMWLAGALREVLRRHEARFGPGGEERRASAGPEFPAADRHGAPPDDLAHPQGRRLFQQVCGLGVPFGYEKSFKLAHGRVFPNRFLVAARARDLRPPADVLELCRRLGMPEAMVADFGAGLGQASTVGFGFEEGARGCMFKAYLEFWDRVREAVLRDPRRDPLLLHLGYKWDCADASRSAVARYTVHPLLPVAGILDRLRGLFPAADDPAVPDAVEQMLALARARISRTDTFVYVEATEEGNPRRSFDVNLYKARLRLEDIAPVVSGLGDRQGVPREELRGLLAAGANCALGHLSGGTDRDGREFLTVYYEVEAL